ncbi:MAG: DNA repair protein RecO [Fibrobacter sp.]|nr:DNA repair protein RecO [Fibrobacter sp.]
MIKSRAIVLHRYAYSDSSWIVKALTEECGIVSFIVKGGKRKESPFKGALDPLSLSEIVFRQNPGTELQFPKEAGVIDWHPHLRENLLSLAKAQVMAEIVMRYAPAGVPLEGEFALLENALREFDTAGNSPEQDSPSISPEQDGATRQNAAPSVSAGNTSGVFTRWLLDICDLWGYNLDTGTCSRCNHPLDGPAADFHPESGNFVCKKCLGVETPRAKPETLLGFWNLRNGGTIEHPEYVENALLAYLRNHVGFMREIHSLKFLNETRKLFPSG